MSFDEITVAGIATKMCQGSLYFILSGLYWLSPLAGSLWLLISPKSLMGSMFSGKNNYKVGRLGGAGMLRHLNNATPAEFRKMRIEVLGLD